MFRDVAEHNKRSAVSKQPSKMADIFRGFLRKAMVVGLALLFAYRVIM